MRTSLQALMISSALFSGSLALDLSSITDKLTNSLFSNIFGEVNSYLNGIPGNFYTPSSSSFNLSNSFCGEFSKLNSSLNISSYLPDIPGLNKRSNRVGLTGASAMCRQASREFSDIVSSSITGIVQYISPDFSGDNAMLPSGQSVKDNLKVWNISEILNSLGDDSEANLARNSIKDGKQSTLRLMQELSKTKAGSLPADINIDDLVANSVPDSMEAYDTSIKELAQISYGNRYDTSPATITSKMALVVNDAIKNREPKNSVSSANTAVSKYMSENRALYESAKANEIKRAIDIYYAQNPQNIAIPTQELINRARIDLRPELIAQIKKQQFEEAQIISNISAEWDKRWQLAQLMGDKEVIMAARFDEEAARQRINELIKNAAQDEKSFQ